MSYCRIVLILMIFVSVSFAHADQSFSTHCRMCEEFGMGFVCHVEELNDLTGLVADSLGNIKSPFQVDEYIDCYMKDRSESNADQWRQDYFNEYRSYIKVTSKSFDVPAQLLQCAFLKESVFDKDVRDSPAGAQGMCQFMPNTRDHVDGIISNANRRRGNGSIDQARLEIQENRVKDIDKAYYQTIIKQDNFLDMWNENFDTLLEQGKYPYDSRPTAFSSVGVKMPQNCVAAAGLYFREIMTHLSFDFEPTTMEELISGSNEGGASKDLMLIMGAAYNAGAGNVNKIIKKTKRPLKLGNIVDRLKESNNSEMTDYIETLENCLGVGNFDPPARWYSGGSKPPLCEEQKVKAKGVGLLPVRLWANE